MTDSTVEAVIVRHIDELEAALKYVFDSMDPALGKAVAETMGKWKKQHEWDGVIEDNLDGEVWVAPRDWKMADNTGVDFDLWLGFDAFKGHGDIEPWTWAGCFCGFSGAGIHLVFMTGSLGKSQWKKLLRSEEKLIDALVQRGFVCDLNAGELSIPISIDRKALAHAFSEENFKDALKPIQTALDNIFPVKDILDQLVAEIRKTPT